MRYFRSWRNKSRSEMDSRVKCARLLVGTYEPDKQALLSKVVTRGMVVWDVGANAGFYTLACSKLVGNEGRVYAFEPLAENVNNLLKHVALNKLANIKIIQTALAGRSELVNF